MPLLNWKPEYAIGVESVDFEHQQMIEMINEIHEEMKTRGDADSIEQFMGDVHFAISAHFALEERLMRDAITRNTRRTRKNTRNCSTRSAT